MGLETYIILYGGGGINEDPNYTPEERHDVRDNFKNAALTRADEIRNYSNFNPNDDAIIIKETKYVSDFVSAINSPYGSGPIQEITTFTHAYSAAGSQTSAGLNLGGGIVGEGKLRWFESPNVNELDPNFAEDAIFNLYGCNTANNNAGSSIAQWIADKFPNVSVFGYLGNSNFIWPEANKTYLVPTYKNKGKIQVFPRK